MKAFQIFLMVLGQLYFLALVLRFPVMVVNLRNMVSLMPDTWSRPKRYRLAVVRYFIPECLGAMATIWVQGKYAFAYASMQELYQLMVRIVGPEALRKEREKQVLSPGDKPSYNRRLQTQTPDEIINELINCNQLQKVTKDDVENPRRVVQETGGDMQREPSTDSSVGIH